MYWNPVLAIFFLFQDIFLVYGKKVVRGEKSKWWLLQFLSTKKWDIYVILASLIFLCLKNMKTALTCLNLDCKIFNWKLEHFPLELMNLFYKFEIIISLLDIGQVCLRCESGVMCCKWCSFAFIAYYLYIQSTQNIPPTNCFTLSLLATICDKVCNKY